MAVTLTGCAFAFLFGFGIISTITIASSIQHGKDEESEAGRTAFSFDDIWDAKFQYSYYSGRWTNNTLLYKDDSGDLMRWDPSIGTREVLVDAAIFKNNSITSYTISADMRFMLFSFGYKQKWRRSFLAKYKIFDLEQNRTDNALIDFPNFGGEPSDATLLYARWAPTGLGLSFVYENDVYYQASPWVIATRITTTGDPVYVTNGAPNWLYEEDVLLSRTAQYWSPDGQRLVFGSFNDTGIPLMKFPIYGKTSDVYGKMAHIPYPKAGYKTTSGELGPNSVASLHMYDVTRGMLHDLPVPEAFSAVAHYFLQVAWANATYVMVTWSNRVQNYSVTSLCYVVSMECVTHLEDEFPGGWVRVPVPKPYFIDGGRRYVTVRSHGVGSSGDWRHVAVVPTQRDAVSGIQYLTDGERDVFSVKAVDESRHLVYYVSSQGNPKDREVFRVGLSDADPALKPVSCLTCDGKCSYNRASFSKDATFYIRRCRGPGIPYDTLFNLSIPSEGTVLINNSALETTIDSKLLPKRKFLEIPVGGGYTAHAQVFLPPDFSEENKYPLLLSTYGGPESQEVLDLFPLSGTTGRWLTHVGSTLGAVVVSVDGRGAGGRGDGYLKELYHRMMTVEVEDQAYAARYFKALPYIDDTKRVAIFGWSYGGSVSTKALTSYPVFSCAVSVAPVISSRYYDTAYMERVMGLDLPTDNEAGYNMTDLTLNAVNMTGKKYMLAHGTQDDNVHFMNAAHMVKVLTDAGVQFKFGMYVDEPHAIRNRKSSSRHLFRSMTNFLRNDCWEMSRDPANVNTGQRLRMSTSLLSVTSGLIAMCQFSRMIL